jgi:enediyne biosynthesis protein E11
MSGIREVVADLVAEGDEINALVAGLDEAGWAAPTPAPGWSVKDQIAHLTFIFDLAATAATDADAFQAMTASAASDFQGAVNSALAA